MPRFRLIDTGIRGGRENIAFDQALAERHREGRIPDTLRFLRFRPSALVGRHQILAEEVNVAACAEVGIEVGRRITGGGAIYLDEGQLGWELVFSRATLPFADLESAARAIAGAAAAGLRRLGVAAAFRPRNDIEVNGRKLGGTGGFFDGPTLFYQGTVLIDFDPARLLLALRVPAAKLARRGLDSAAERLVTLRALLGATAPSVAAVQQALIAGFGEHLGIVAEPELPRPEEEAHAAQLLQDEIGTDAFVHQEGTVAAGAPEASASMFTAGGTVRLDLRIERAGEARIREALISGDFFATPPRAVLDLEASLRGVPLAEAAQAAREFFQAAGATIEGLSSETIGALLAAALGKAALRN